MSRRGGFCVHVRLSWIAGVVHQILRVFEPCLDLLSVERRKRRNRLYSKPEAAPRVQWILKEAQNESQIVAIPRRALSDSDVSDGSRCCTRSAIRPNRYANGDTRGRVRYDPSASTCRKRRSSTSVVALLPRAGPTARPSPTSRRACSSRSSRNWSATGARATTGARRSEAQCLATVRHDDRRRGHPLHPRPLASSERLAADHDPRLARVGVRAAQDRRSAHRSDGLRRTRGRRLRPRHAFDSRLTAFPASRRAPVGTPTASREPGRS